MLGADVRGAQLARLLVGREQRGLRVGGQRGRDVGALALLGLLLELRRDRLGIRADLLENVADDVVLKRAVEQMVALEVEAPPLESGLGASLEQLPRRVAEELGDVHAFGPPRRRLRRGRAAAGRRAVEEVREELVEEAAAAPEPAGHPLLGEVDLAEVLDLLRSVGQRPDPGGDRRPPVALA